MWLVLRHPHYLGVLWIGRDYPRLVDPLPSLSLITIELDQEKLDPLDLLSLLELLEERPDAEMLGRVLLRAGLGSYEQRSDRTRDLDARVNHNAPVKQRVREFHRRIAGTRSEPSGFPSTP